MYKLKHSLTAGAAQEMLIYSGSINNAVLKEMDRFAKEFAKLANKRNMNNQYEAIILTQHVAEAIKNVKAKERKND